MKEQAVDSSPALRGLRMDRRVVDRLAARGLISAPARDHALALIEPSRRWGLWTGRLMATVGAALVLAGIIYFFAFNWNALPPLAKLGGIAALIAVACGSVVILGFEGAASTIAATAAVTLVGVFLAVQGQIDQSGADAWTLFAAWAGLTLPWALLAGAAAPWAVWLGVAALALITGWDQTQPADAVFNAGRNLSLMALFAAALGGREALAAAGFAFAAPRWTRFFLALPLLAVVTLAALVLLEAFEGYGLLEGVALVIIPLILLALGVVYRFVLPDVMLLAGVALTGCAILDFALFRLLSGDRTRPEVSLYLVMGLITLALFAAAVAGLRAVARTLEARP